MGRILFLLLISINLNGQYCIDSASSSGDFSDITRVSIYHVTPTSLTHVFTNTSSCGTTGNPATSYVGRYSDYTNHNIFLMRGETYLFKLTRKRCPNTVVYPSNGWDHFMLGMDYMNTGFITLGHLGFGNLIGDTHEYTIQIPLTTTFSDTRMRIRFNNICNVQPNCTTYFDGETEDYTVHFCKPLTYSVFSEQPKCFGDSNGRANVVINGGLAPIKIKWNNGPYQFKDSIVTLKEGHHYVRILDAGKCEYIDSFDLYNPYKLTAGIMVDSTCQSDSVGKITITSSGGVGDHYYSFDNQPYSMNSVKQDLPAGTYNLKIKDDNNCLLDTNVSIYSKNYPLISYAVNVDSINCYYKKNGKVTLNASSGNPPYQYSINNLAYQSSNVFNNLSAGNHLFKITDSKNCYKKLNLMLSAPDTIKLQINSIQHINCIGDSSGSVAISTIGGKTPSQFNYLWGTGATTNSISNLKKGVYSVSVTDTFNCSKSASIFIDNKYDTLKLSCNFIVKNTCKNDSTGTLILSATGGLAPYQYSLDGINYSSNETFKFIKDYYVDAYVKDANSCIFKKDSIFTYYNMPFSVNVVKDNNLCYDVDKSHVLFQIKEGAHPCQVKLDTFNWSLDTFYDNLKTNRYFNFILKDANNCIYKDSFILNLKKKPVNDIVKFNNICLNDAKGVIQITKTDNAVSPVLYSFNSNGFTSQKLFNNLNSGRYLITTKDSINCVINDTIDIKTNSKFSFNIKQKNISCFGFDNGEIEVLNVNSLKPVLLNFDYLGFSSKNYFSNLKSKRYDLRINYDSICYYDTFVMLTQPTQLNLNINIDSVKCYGDSNGVLNILPQGGTAPYYISLDNNSFFTKTIYSGLKSGNYTISIKDSHSCTYSASVFVPSPAMLVNQLVRLKNISCFGLNDGEIHLNTSGGNPPYSYIWLPNVSATSTSNNLKKGTYYIKTSDQKKCSIEEKLDVFEPPKLEVAIKVLNENICHDDKKGKVKPQVKGGIAPYQYLWNTSTLDQISPSSKVRIIVTDSNYCVDSAFYSFRDIPKININYKIKNPTCYNISDGSIALNVTGGIPFTSSKNNYLYSIDSQPFQSSTYFTSLASRYYYVKVKDSLGCIIDTPIELKAPERNQVYLDSILYLNNIGDEVVLTPILSHYNAIYNLKWSPSVGLSCVDCLNPVFASYISQKYLLKLYYNENKCVDSASIKVIVPSSRFDKLYIPNAFSPENYIDVENSVFKVYGNDILNVEMSIFNRWGELVYKKIGDKNVGWDGKFKGNVSESGVYSYHIIVYFLDKKTVERKGTVTLLK